MEMLDLRGACRPGNFEESGVDKDGTGSKHEIHEKVRGLIWPRLFDPQTLQKDT